MVVWLYELLGRWLGVSDGKRRISMCQQRGRALGIFDEAKRKLNSAKDVLAGEQQLCEARVAKKRIELESDENDVGVLTEEQRKIDLTVANIDKMLGNEEHEAKGDIN